MPTGRTTRSKKSRRSFAGVCRSPSLALGEQLCDGHLKRIGKPLNDSDGWVAHAALDPADVCPVYPKLQRELFLCQPFGSPQSAYVQTKALAHIHRSRINSDVGGDTTDDKYHFSLDLPAHASDVVAMDQVSSSTIRYIKLGAGGRWESALDHGRLEWGTASDRCTAVLSGDWPAVTQAYIAQGRLPATATGYANEARAFFDADPTALWITVARGRLWWCFAEPEVHTVEGDEDANAAFYRIARGGWSDRDVNGGVLDLDRLSTRLTQLQGYQRAICGLTADQAALFYRYVNATLDPVQTAIAAARAELKEHLRSLIKRLTWRDFEQLIDLAFARTGWLRVSSLGGTMKDVDLVVEQTFTRERISVQIKSKADQRVVDDYARRLDARTAGERIMLICHSPTGHLAVPPPTTERRLELVLDGEIADLSINAGLVDWVIARAL